MQCCGPGVQALGLSIRVEEPDVVIRKTDAYFHAFIVAG
jgi:hypothetical protein